MCNLLPFLQLFYHLQQYHTFRPSPPFLTSFKILDSKNLPPKRRGFQVEEKKERVRRERSRWESRVYFPKQNVCENEEEVRGKGRKKIATTQPLLPEFSPVLSILFPLPVYLSLVLPGLNSFFFVSVRRRPNSWLALGGMKKKIVSRKGVMEKKKERERNRSERKEVKGTYFLLIDVPFPGNRNKDRWSSWWIKEEAEAGVDEQDRGREKERKRGRKGVRKKEIHL